MPELWGLNPSTAAWNFDHYFAKGRAPLWNDMGNGNWAMSPDYAPVVLRVYNAMLAWNGQAAQCPPDGLIFGPLTAISLCPVGLRQPGRAVASTPSGGYYVLNGDGTVRAYRGAPAYGSPSYASDLARDIAVMPDGNGYAVLNGWGAVDRFGSAADPATIGALDVPYVFDVDHARSIAITPDGHGYVVLLADGTVTKWGSAATGPLAALESPAFGGDDARSIALMPDGAGYLVLDKFGGVWKYGSATQGVVGLGQSESFPFDVARDIVIVSAWFWPLGYFVVDGWGGVWGTQGLAPRADPRAQVFVDRWRGAAIIGGVPFLVRDDGTTVTTVEK